MNSILKATIVVLCISAAKAFVPSFSSSELTSSTQLFGNAEDNSASSRRLFLETTLATSAAVAMIGRQTAFAAEADGLEAYLYKVVRVREATQQETRLIKSGKFKDIQRANVKLAVKFMVQNYRLSDSVVAASAYLQGGNSIKAIDVGQAAIQNLQTILEYFDTSDVENIKVSQFSVHSVFFRGRNRPNQEQCIWFH